MFGDLFSQNADYQTGILYQGRRKFLKPAGNVLEPPQDFKTKRQSRRSHTKPVFISPAEKLAPLPGVEIAPQHLSAVIMNTKNSFLNLRSNGDAKGKRTNKSGKLKPMVIQHYSSIDSKDWEEQYQAGCHLYVNKNTGEVSELCPWRRDLGTVSQMLTSLKSGSPMANPTPNHQTPTHSPARNIMLTPLPPLLETMGSTNLFNTMASGNSIGSMGSIGSGISTGTYRVYDDADNLGTGSLVYDRSELDDMLHVLDSAKKRLQYAEADL